MCDEFHVQSLRKLMVSHDLSRSTVTEQIAFDQRDLHSTPEFERAMDRRCQALVSKFETLGPSLLPNCTGGPQFCAYSETSL